MTQEGEVPPEDVGADRLHGSSKSFPAPMEHLVWLWCSWIQSCYLIALLTPRFAYFSSAESSFSIGSFPLEHLSIDETESSWGYCSEGFYLSIIKGHLPKLKTICAETSPAFGWQVLEARPSMVGSLVPGETIYHRLSSTLNEVFSALADGGWSFSFVSHPCFPV